MTASPVPAAATPGHRTHARRELACALRWAARLGLHEGVANHFSLALDAEGARFLVNPYGRHFSRVRASDLLEVDGDDPDTLDRPDAPDPTAWGLHGALHRNCPHARCVLHVHSHHATVLASLADSAMPPIDQNTARFYRRVVVDEHFQGMAFETEGERCAALLGTHRVMVMGNHGLLVVGPSVARAFDDLYYFERAARTLITAMATGRELRVMPGQVAEKTARQWEEFGDLAERHFQELTAILDDEEPDYRQ